MRYCISDIHGEYDKFMKLLDSIEFSDSDFLYVCGDIIDKGSDSVRLMKYIFNMPNAKSIVGNHEFEFLKRYYNMIRKDEVDFDEVLKKLREYFTTDGHLLDWDTVDTIENLPYYIEEDDFICVHAGIPLDAMGRLKPLADVSNEALVYDRQFKEPDLLPYDSKCVIFGHTPTRYLCGMDRILTYERPGRKGTSIRDYYKVHLDTGVWIGGVLGCFCIDTCMTYAVK